MGVEWWQQPCRSVDSKMADAARSRQDQLTKPQGALGQLEAWVVTLAGLQGRELPRVDPVWISLFAADHGVVAENISAYPQAVTAQMLDNLAKGGAAISVLARQLDAVLELVNLGTVQPLALEGILNRELGPGTANLCREPAMTSEQCQTALAAGRNSVQRALAQGSWLYLAGEMGIGNTTSASALACALLDCEPALLCGPGAGLDAPGVAHKATVIQKALDLHGAQLCHPLRALTCLGGFEIAALAGAYVHAAQQGLVVLVDGFICTVAALCAVRLNPGCRPWLLFAHRSAEPGHGRVLDALKAEPLVDLGLRLGEGSGAALVVPLLQAACALQREMATFEQAEVSERSSPCR